MEKHKFIKRFEDITKEKIENNRKRKNVYLKIIFSKVLKDKGYNLYKIRDIIGLANHATIIHHLKNYDNLMNYDDFEKMYNKYSDVIKSIIDNNPISIELYYNKKLLENFNNIENYKLKFTDEKLIINIYE